MRHLRILAASRRAVRRNFSALRIVAALSVLNWLVVRATTSGSVFHAPLTSLDLIDGAICVIVAFVLLLHNRLVERPIRRRISAITRELSATNERLVEQSRQSREHIYELEVQLDDLVSQRNDLLGVHDALLFQQDATASVQARLAEREARYRSVVDSLSEGVILQDVEGTIVAWNASAERILGLSGDKLAGRSTREMLWSCVDEDGVPIPYEKLPSRVAIDTSTPQRGAMLCLRGPDGTVRWVSVNAQPVIPANNATPTHVVSSFEDVTDARIASERLARLSTIVQQSEELIVITAPAGEIAWANDAWCRKTGYSLSEAVGKLPGELLDGPDTNTLDVAELQAASEKGERWSGELQNYRKDGTSYWVEVSISPVRNARGIVTSFFSIERDITERREAARERQRFMAALAVTADGVVITSDAGIMEFVNHALARMHGYRPADLIGKHVHMLCSPEEVGRIRNIVMDDIDRHGSWQGNITSLRKDGAVFPADLSLTALPSGGAVYALRDITDAVAAQEALKSLSLHDELTGLYNRRGFINVAAQQLAASQRAGTSCLLLFGDLDRFKAINDTFGHDAGDEALKTVAQLLSQALRPSDIVARLGGDEFTVLAANASLADEQALRGRITECIENWNNENGERYKINLSLGVAGFDPAQPMDLEALMREADARLYVNKSARRFSRAA